MKKLTWALLSLMLFLGMGAAFADEGVTITLNPASGETVSDGTQVAITFETTEGYTVSGVYYMLGETKEELEALSNMAMMEGEEYAEDHKPVITAAKPFLRIRYTSNTKEASGRPVNTIMNEYADYTIATGDIANPVFVVEGNPVTSYDVTFNAMFSIQRGEGDNDSELWYTTDGSTPAKDGDKSTKFTEAFEIGSVLGDDEEGEVTIKAIAVAADGKTSAVVMATFTVKPGEPAKFVFTDPMGGVVPEGYYGKYVGLMPMVIKNEWPMAYQMYYTVDGETEPSEEAFDDQDADADGPIYMISFDGEEMPSMMFTENTTVLKAVIHAMMMDLETGQPDMSTAEVLNLDERLKALSVDEEVEFKVNEEGKLEITNADEFTMIYYTTDGTVPSFGNATNGELYDEDDMIELEAGKTVKIVGYSVLGGGMGTSFTAGSDMVEVTKPLAPTFEPASGTKVDFGAELTLNCATEDVMILYTLDGSEPSTDNDYAHYYNENMKPGITAKTIKAVAMVKGVYSEVVTAT
ncbi:MAG: chitobiase/beta-hexosaminidase C-terminal domain-containing protein, partial [Bacteroidales bacterium]|nr:chitobiase/beta-hexosaminidase C-terminal domain-containing protein [Bacteroidales bacterium]